MFPIWKCRISFVQDYGYMKAFFYSIWCVALLYFANGLRSELRSNPLYILGLSLTPVVYFIMVKNIQHRYECDTSRFLETDAPFLYFFVISIVSVLIALRETDR